MPNIPFSSAEKNAMRATRTLHDAELIATGAEYVERYEDDDGLLTLTSDQIEILRVRRDTVAAPMGLVAIANQGELGLARTTPEYLDREIALKDRIHALTGPYVTALHEQARTAAHTSVTLPGLGAIVKYDIKTHRSNRDQDLETSIQVTSDKKKTDFSNNKLALDLVTSGSMLEELIVSDISYYNGTYEATIMKALHETPLRAAIDTFATKRTSVMLHAISASIELKVSSSAPLVRVKQKKNVCTYTYDATTNTFRLSTGMLLHEFGHEPQQQPSDHIEIDDFMQIIEALLQLIPVTRY